MYYTRPNQPATEPEPQRSASQGSTEPTRPAPRFDPDGITQPVPVLPPGPEPAPKDLPGPAVPMPPPADNLGSYQPIRRGKPPRRKARWPWNCGCLLIGLVLGALVVVAILFVAAAVLFSPGKTNLMILGIDRVEGGKGAVARSDTLILVQIDPGGPRAATLAIPRDLWVKIPGVGENRINTAHFFAEANHAGSGPAAAAETVRVNFGVASSEYVRIHLEGVPALIDAMGGVTINLKEATALYPAGEHHLDGTQALAFVRDRKGADDFFRMAHGQLFVRAVAQQLLNPATWVRLPLILAALPKAVDSNIPATQIPALALTLLRIGPEGIETHTLPREATTPTTTSSGAMVLMPVWERIKPLVAEIFEK